MPDSNGCFALRGRVVPMAGPPVADGCVYVDGSTISDVRPAAAGPPDGFDGVAPLDTRGTIYPGLIELHNHLSYDVLPMWQVPALYPNRDAWQGTSTYTELISGPMRVLGKIAPYPAAVVRYVEGKCLLGGVTTSQGVPLYSFSGIQSYYPGLVRNVESPRELDVPAWEGHIGDVDGRSLPAFRAELGRRHVLLHLAEGVDAAAHKHFTDLHGSDGDWAVTPNLVGIHCVALDSGDFETMASRGAAMVWSPLSNLLLYGRTAAVQQAKAASLPIALGSDWSPTGSKNLFAELKVARAVSRHEGLFDDEELVAMATSKAAEILGWESAVGTLQAGRQADLLVVDGTGGDPYAHLLDAPEHAIKLVTIGGRARYGTATLLRKLAPPPAKGLERIRIDGQSRLLDLRDDETPPPVAAFTLAQATATLEDALHRLPELWQQLERTPAAYLLAPDDPHAFMLVLDNEPPPSHVRGAQARKPSLAPMELDPLCVSADPDYYVRLARQRNLPEWLDAALH